MVKVKNKGNPIYIGKSLCRKGTVTPVKKEDLESYLKTPGGASLLNVSLFVFDEDFVKKQNAELMALKSQAHADVRKELEPVIYAECEEKISKRFEDKIKSFEDKIKSQVNEIDHFANENANLVKQLNDAGSVPETVETVETETVEEINETGFIFDPEKHSIEHKGGGHWFVMEGEKKVSESLTEDEREAFNKLIEA